MTHHPDARVPHPYAESDYLPLRNAYEAARTQFGEDKVALPFVPYVGKKYRESRERLLLIGKATNGWEDPCSGRAGDPASFECGRQHSASFITHEVTPGRYRSAFWSFAVRAACAVHRLGDPNQQTAEALDRIAWTNLIKIGAHDGNAGRGLVALQEKTCAELLKKELTALNPTVVLITTGSTYSQLVYRAFGEYKAWCLPAGFTDKELMTQPHGATRVFWTRHPQGASKELLARYLELLIAKSPACCEPGGTCRSSA